MSKLKKPAEIPTVETLSFFFGVTSAAKMGKVYHENIMIRRPTVTDMNEAVSNGFYIFTGATANAPASGNGVLMVIAFSSAYLTQIFFLNGNPRPYIRTKTNSTFSDWKRPVLE